MFKHLAAEVFLSTRFQTLFVFLLFALPVNLTAQSNNIKVEQLTVGQGLSFNEVTAIIQDSRGFMWFGTANGLNKYDGYSFTTYKYDPLDSASISTPWINLLYEDTHGDLWIIATRWLNRLDRVTGRITRHLSNRYLTSICEDTSSDVSQDGMWFTTFGQGIYRYDRRSKRFTEYRHKPNDSSSISSDSAYCASVDVAGTLWIGTANGLNSNDKSRRQFIHYASGPKENVYTVYEDPHESSKLLWIGANDGLYVYDRSSDSFSHYRNDLGNPKRSEDNDVRTVYCDRKGRLWVGMKGGIARFDRSTRRFTSYQGGLWTNTWGYVIKAWSICEDKTGTMWMVSQWGPLRRYDEVKNEWTPIQITSDHEILFHALCEDRSGTMWFGTADDAVLKLDRARKPFSLYTKIPGDSSSLSSATVTGISEDALGTVWVGTLLGLNKLNASTGKFTHYRHDDRNPHSLSNDVIQPVLEDGTGVLWIGTEGGGLDEFDKRKLRFVHHTNNPGDSLSLAYNFVDALYAGRDGTLWIGTNDCNISEYAPALNTFRRHLPGYAKTGGLGGNVRAILEDHSGLIWIAVPPTGLHSYDRHSDRWTQYVGDQSAGNGRRTIVPPGALSLCEDRGGMIWVGTNVGLFRFDRLTETFTLFSVKDGLADNYIDAILEDGKGRLWLCTVNGLSRFDPDNGSVRNYDASDGVKIGPCKIPTGHKGRKGEMFFGGSNGFVRFHPDSIKDNPHIPPIVITAFKKFDKLVSLDSAITEKRLIEISYQENVFSFEFAALNYTSPEKNQYAYKLEGFDDEWTYCGTRRYATYTNLDGGRYIFRVKGSNNDGEWNEEGTSIAVIITPPFWATWWFRSFAFIAMLVSVGGSIRYVEIRKLKRKIVRLEQEHALERERLRISQDMHDEVGATLTEIAILSELAKKDIRKPKEAGTHVQQISDRAAEVIDNIGEIIWAINPKNDSLDNLIAHVRRHSVQYLGLARIGCTFIAPESIPPYNLSAEARRNLFLVVKESLHNVVKHSAATEVVITVHFTDGTLEMSIKDNGRGFQFNGRAESGNGLGNMNKRLADIGGTFKIESKPDNGTSISIVTGIAPRP